MTKQYLTRSNVAHDLNISPHTLELRYPEQSIVYVFSSELYKSKFSDKLQENRLKINESLTNRFGFCIKQDLLADLKLYLTIEKRGFLLYVNGRKVEWLDKVALHGQTINLTS